MLFDVWYFILLTFVLIIFRSAEADLHVLFVTIKFGLRFNLFIGIYNSKINGALTILFSLALYAEAFKNKVLSISFFP